MKNLLLLTAMLCLLLITACNTIKDEVLAPVDETPDAMGYYTSSNNGFTLKYKVTNDSLHCILSAASTGWVSVGFDPSDKMKDANFIIGYVTGGVANIRDDWGISQTEHTADVGLGGTDNVTPISGSEVSGKTTVEFAIPLNSGDSKDKALAVGSAYHIIFAKGSADSFSGMHNSFGWSTISLH